MDQASGDAANHHNKKGSSNGAASSDSTPTNAAQQAQAAAAAAALGLIDPSALFGKYLFLIIHFSLSKYLNFLQHILYSLPEFRRAIIQWRQCLVMECWDKEVHHLSVHLHPLIPVMN